MTVVRYAIELEACPSCGELVGHLNLDTLTALHAAHAVEARRDADATRDAVSESEWRLLDGNR
jgi:hypothetical protein